MLRLIVAVTLALAAVAGPAQAAGSAQEQAACRPDVRKLCGSIGKGDDEKYKSCLQAHFSQLSQKCQQVLMSHNSQ